MFKECKDLRKITYKKKKLYVLFMCQIINFNFTNTYYIRFIHYMY